MITEHISLNQFSDLPLLSYPFISGQNKNSINEKDSTIINETLNYYQEPYQNANESKTVPKRKFFTQYEDHLLITAVELHNQTSWNDIAKCVPGKTSKQCRDRWMNYLQPSLKFDPWSAKEDQLLLSLVSNKGTHWTKMKKFFPNRSTNSLKNRFHWLYKNQIQCIPYFFQMQNLKEIQLTRKNSETFIKKKDVDIIKQKSTHSPSDDLINSNNQKNMMEDTQNCEFNSDLFNEDEFLKFDEDELCW